MSSPSLTREPTERRHHEEAVLQSEERFRLLVEAVKDYAIFMLDPQGHVVTWNSGAESIKGYRAEEILGRHFSVFYPAEAVERGWPEHELKVAVAEGRFEDEGWRVRKDGSVFWANVVITTLWDAEKRLRGFAKITRDMTERRRVEALEEAETQNNEFLAMLAHELRNPLAPISNALGVLRMSGSADSVTDWSINVIQRQIGHLTRLVDDLLDASRITSKKVTLHMQPLEIAQVMRSAVESSQPLITTRGHTLAVHVPDEPLWVEGDLTRLSQVVMNLLNNAAKYTPQGGRIWLTAGKEEECAVLRVKDTGIGIPAHLLPKVFDLFTQGDRSLDRAEGGLGIGLTLARQLIEQHGGSIEALSEGRGRGSELVVHLPILRRTLPPQSGPAGELDSPPRSARRVLIVDDSPDSAETLATLVELWGHEARTAFNGPDALALAAKHRPDIALLDIGLPGMSGYVLAQHLREISRSTTLVAVTGYGDEDDLRQAADAGFEHHLVKPVDPQRLQKLIASI